VFVVLGVRNHLLNRLKSAIKPARAEMSLAGRRPDPLAGRDDKYYEIPITLPLLPSRKPMRRVAPHHTTKAGTSLLSPRGSLRIGAPHAGYRHAGPRVRLVRGGNWLRLRLRTTL